MPDADLQERIRSRAYLLWEQEGRPEGRAEAHWLRAEAELADVNPGEEADVNPGEEADVNPGEEAPPGTPGAGVRRKRAPRGQRCKDCGGTGRSVEVPEP